MQAHHLALQYPLIQAPMAGGATTADLVATVSNAGALGTLVAGYMQAQELQQTIHQIRKLSTAPFAINVFVPQPYTQNLQQIQHAQQTVQMACHELSIQIKRPHAPYLPNFNAQMTVIKVAKQVGITVHF